ncbi:hypothetical protein EG329_005162 [Mollisiaceae sp. DMI_Dod_QoI]|nr:hypothetical protein EG329_005162 [Helotiales sp. DMI_Dod_QoI]
MANNKGNTDSGYLHREQLTAKSRSSSISPLEIEPHTSVHSSQSSLNQPGQESAAMSTLTIRAPSMLSSPWADRRPLDFPLRPRSQASREALPSIRQIIPDFHQTRPRRTESEYSIGSYSPTSRSSPQQNSSDYAQPPSIQKRRRLSCENDYEDSRDQSIPRLYVTPPRTTTRPLDVPISPTSFAQQQVAFPADPLNEADRNRTYVAGQTSNAPTVSRFNGRTLPRIPSLALVDVSGASSRRRSVCGGYALDPSRREPLAYPQQPISPFDPPTPMSVYPHPSSTYGYQQPRCQSFSGPPTYSTTHERTPFPFGHQSRYTGSGYPYGGSDGNDGSNDGKQRKRRGNLPKETTDKLRAWFFAHLTHPYPTEDEKQDLMRQTGLQMNQISNWFINARRRQLPELINQARVEYDARVAGRRESALTGESLSDFGDDREKRGSESDGMGSDNDDEFELRQAMNKKRGSI